MRKKVLFVVVCAICMLLTSCNQPGSTGGSGSFWEEPTEYWILQCVNNSKYPFTVTIKGNTSTSFVLDGQKYINQKVEVGYYRVHVKQNSGYWLYPTEADYEGYVTSSEMLVVSFSD